ncbi:MAG: hypothetical protein JXR73_05550 [Candidatus Omnitrophica bacterium]|nr:hypothetical protein [Candidatus Omnitrophota bacterium]
MMLTELQGQIERITYFNDETGCTIACLKVYGRHDLVAVVGTMHPMNPGEIVYLRGDGAIISNSANSSKSSLTNPRFPRR